MKVTNIHLHQQIFIPTMGNLSGSVSTMKEGVEMEWDGEAPAIKCFSLRHNLNFYIPLVNLESIVYEPQKPKKQDEKK